MTCWNCGRFFCYQCSAAISGYDHFNGDCVIFDEAEIDRWQMPMNRRLHRMVVGQAQVALLARGHAYPCPTCGQAIRKIGNNNHLYCWSCNQHCCALCRTSVQKMSQHFGPTGCKQHTENPWCYARSLEVIGMSKGSLALYSLRSELLVTKMDVSITKIHLDTFISWTSNSERRREYLW